MATDTKHPNPPSEVKINGKDEETDQVTKSTGEVTITAKLSDPVATRKLSLVVQYAPKDRFAAGSSRKSSTVVANTKRATVKLTGLQQNTLYYARLYTRNPLGNLSKNFASITFWTNRYPTAPDTYTPEENAEVEQSSPLRFSWKHNDPDDETGAIPLRYQVRYRTAPTTFTQAGDWVSHVGVTSAKEYTTDSDGPTTEPDHAYRDFYVVPGGTFLANTAYEWQVRTMDPQGTWGEFSYPQSFFISGVSLAPILLDPTKGEAVDVTKEVTFRWTFRDPDQGNHQASADIRYRVAGTEEWFLLDGNTTDPGGAQEWTLPPETFVAGVSYEWQARTTDVVVDTPSDWSSSASFWTIRTGTTEVIARLLSEYDEPVGTLGVGTHRVFIYDQGGTRLRGEITPLASLMWNRKRDDISNCLLTANDSGTEPDSILAEIRSWLHEVVIFRDGVRVFEGPITRITYTPDSVEVEAKDVMAYVYRRIMRQGYNDSYQIMNGRQIGLRTVVERATKIIQNALAPWDPNVLPYLTPINYPDDARQSRVVLDYSKTAWEEVDDLAATAGLDYVTVGRRIMLWDTHRPIGRLPEMRDEHFSDPPVVTEYGMNLATDFVVTNNGGVWGLATRPRSPYGPIEQLASAYGEADGGATDVLTPAARLELERTLASQAERSIAARWPTPLVVRVPDNSTIHPDTPVGINQLVPGVWLPIRATGTARNVAQWQKLDLVTVTQTPQGETVQVTMAPAPNSGEDPDGAAAAAEED